ncbi:MAG: hypothetical protein PF484_12920 [Bacteroidales bacterium]|nr:hypothetical protein [Bacteroidales bacterium]
MYPENNVISYSDNLLGSAPIYSFFRLIGFDIYKSFQLWFLAVSALNYIFAFYFLKYVFKNNYAAVLGAFIFAFSIALQSQLTHAQTFPRFAIPIALLMAVKFSEELKPKHLFYTLLSLVYQIYCGIYLGFMLAVPIGIYSLTIIIREILYKNKLVSNYKWLLQITLYSVLNIVVLLPLMLPYMDRKISPSIEHYKQIMGSIPTIKSHLFSQQGSLIWDFLSKTGQSYEAWWNHQIFAGGIATVCLLIGTFFLISKAIKFKFQLKSYSTPLILLFTGLLTFFLHIRFKEISAYITLYFLPGFSSMRSLARIINIELIFFGIATAFVFTKIFKKYVRYELVIFIAALSLLICDNYFYKEKSYKTKVILAENRTKDIEKTFKKIPFGSVVSYEPLQIESASIYYQIDAMLTSQKFGLKTLNGYTATCPGDYGMYWNEPNEKSRNYWLNNKTIDFDTLYVVKACDVLEIVPAKEIQDFDLGAVKETRLENLINYIRTDKKWMKQIEKKAIKNNISIDSMIVLDAKWVISNKK